jgi:hypothetical protein
LFRWSWWWWLLGSGDRRGGNDDCHSEIRGSGPQDSGGLVFCDLPGGSDGQEGVVPGRVGTVGAVLDGVGVVAGVPGVFALCGRAEAVSVSIS